MRSIHSFPAIGFASLIALLLVSSVTAETTVHSHNDFAQDRPLDTALENRVTSIEVDVTDRGNEVSVVHLGVWTYGTLKEMYLDRLQKRVDEKGSVYGDGKLFTIWIEIRPIISGAAIVPMMRKLLASYPMLTQYSADGKIVRPGPVQAVLMNNYSRDYFTGLKTAPACQTVSSIDHTTAPNAPFQCWIHLHWERFFTWNGEGEMPSAEVARLKEIQNSAHLRGLKTRFWAAPDTVSFWKQTAKLPFDLIGTDHLKRTTDALKTSISP